LIFGPGEAKGELKERLEQHKLGSRIAAIETADKMTNPQISAKVRTYFGEKNSGQPGGRRFLPRSNSLTPNRAGTSDGYTPDGRGYHDND
jgi:hypothetical protein